MVPADYLVQVQCIHRVSAELGRDGAAVPRRSHALVDHWVGLGRCFKALHHLAKTQGSSLATRVAIPSQGDQPRLCFVMLPARQDI